MGLLIDESHHAGSPTAQKIVLAVPAYFRLGASDSLKESEMTRYTNVLGLFGPALFFQVMLSLQETATQLNVTGDAKELDQLSEDFKFRPEGFFYSLLYERYELTKGQDGWDGYIRPFKRFTRCAAQILRGRKQELLAVCRLHGYEVDTARLLPYPFADLTVDDVAPDLIAGSSQLDLFQRTSIQRWLAAGIGNVKATVSAGKTAMYAGAAALIKQRFPEARFLYLTPAERLVRQVTQEMRKFLPGWDIGQFGGGQRQADAKDMVVCTVAMLGRHYAGLQEKGWFITFMGLLFDESHHAGSPTAQKVVLAVPAYFRLGASDSLKESDMTRYTSVLGLFGPVLNEVRAAPLMDMGWLARPHIYLVDEPGWQNRLNHVEFQAAPGSNAFVLDDDEWCRATYLGPVFEKDDQGGIVTRDRITGQPDGHGGWLTESAPVTLPGLHRMKLDGEEEEREVESRWCLLDRMYDRAIIQFKERNDLVVRWAAAYSNAGLPTLVVCSRLQHIYILEALLMAVLPPERVEILFGLESPAERDACFEWLRTTPGAVLVSPLVKEGVSINELAAGVIADPVADHEVANQIIGRFLRKKASGVQRAYYVTMFFDRQHRVLRRSVTDALCALERIDGHTFYHPAPSPEKWAADFAAKKTV